jgi:hypothetical protein
MSSAPDSDSPLPPGWTKGYSNSQKRHYYVHAKTKHTQWHFPTKSEATDPLMAKRRADANKKRQAESLGTIISDIQVTPTNSNRKPAKRARATVNDALDVTSSSVAIIVPFRDLHASQQRAQHLQRFLPHMHQFLGNLVNQKKISAYHIYIVQQSDDGRKFNRGKLLNIGYDVARKSPCKHDVFIFHDVDLLPQKNLGDWYAAFPTVPIHIARVWDRYSNNEKYFGGVVSFSSSDYKRINGYPNTFWGWGGEDDEMQQRLEKLHIKWTWPDEGTLVDLEEMTLTEKLDFLRSNKEWKCQMKWEALKEHEATWKTNGLADLKYTLLETTMLDATKNASKLTVDVKLNGNQWDSTSSIDYRWKPNNG